MKKLISLLFFSGLLSCNTNREKSFEISKTYSTLLTNISKQDTSLNPCRQFKKLNTADEYFESANNRTKECSGDSLTSLIALKEYEFAIALNPNFWQARRNYAGQLFGFKDYVNCIKHLNITLESVSSEDNPDLNVLRGQAYYEIGKFKEAINDYDIGIKYLANTDYIHLLKAKAEWKLGLKEQAVKIIRQQ